MKTGAVETGENGCGVADHERKVRHRFGGVVTCCVDFLVDLLSEVPDRNITIYVFDVALSIGGLGFVWL